MSNLINSNQNKIDNAIQNNGSVPFKKGYEPVRPGDPVNLAFLEKYIGEYSKIGTFKGVYLSVVDMNIAVPIPKHGDLVLIKQTPCSDAYIEYIYDSSSSQWIEVRREACSSGGMLLAKLDDIDKGDQKKIVSAFTFREYYEQRLKPAFEDIYTRLDDLEYFTQNLKDAGRYRGVFHSLADVGVSIGRPNNGDMVLIQIQGSTGFEQLIYDDVSSSWRAVATGSTAANTQANIEQGGVAWKPNKLYYLGDLATFDELVMIALINHTSTTKAADTLKWSTTISDAGTF